MTEEKMSLWKESTVGNRWLLLLGLACDGYHQSLNKYLLPLMKLKRIWNTTASTITESHTIGIVVSPLPSEYFLVEL